MMIFSAWLKAEESSPRTSSEADSGAILKPQPAKGV
jgi:hypothetical protein